MKTYRVGLVGLGRIASLYEKDRRARRHYPALTHAGTFAGHPRTSIVAACDRDPRRLAAFGRKWGVSALFRDHEEMFRSVSLDILSVCTGPEAHREVVSAAASRVRLIFCEKPVGKTPKDTAAVVAACRRRKTPLLINCTRLYDPAHRSVGRLIRKGHLGAIQRVNCFYGKGLRNMGSHLLSLLGHYFGDITAVKTLAIRSLGDGQEKTADFVARLSSGTPCWVQGCDFRRYRIFEMDILGTKGRLRLDREGFGFHLFRAGPHRAETGARDLFPRPSPVRATIGRALEEAVRHLVAVLDGGVRPMFSGADYLETERVVAAVLRSGRRGRWTSVGAL